MLLSTIEYLIEARKIRVAENRMLSKAGGRFPGKDFLPKSASLPGQAGWDAVKYAAYCHIKWSTIDIAETRSKRHGCCFDSVHGVFSYFEGRDVITLIYEVKSEG